MVEYRQRLRVMLSASQGKYELERYSGSIANKINYIYYFTYFHPYSTYPYWEEFKGKIEGKVEGLEKSITDLRKSHNDLKETVTTTRDNTSLILSTIDLIDDTVKESIDKLKDHITEQIVENKECIEISSDNIGDSIDKININLQNYIKKELKDIASNFKENVKSYFSEFYKKLEENIKIIKEVEKTIDESIICEINQCINQINHFYDVIFRLVLGLIHFNCDFEIVFREICFEKIRTNINKLNRELPELKGLVEELKEPKIEQTVRDVTFKLSYEELGNVDTILRPFQEYVEELEGKKEAIKTKKEAISKAFDKIKEELDKLEKVKLILQKLKDSNLLQVFCDLECLIEATLTKIKELNAKLKIIDSLLQKVEEQLCALDQGIKTVKEEIQGKIKNQLEELNLIKGLSGWLNVIKCLNDNLKAYITQSEKEDTDQTKVIKQKIENLLKKDEICIKKIIEKKCVSRYLAYVECMKRFREKLLKNVKSKVIPILKGKLAHVKLELEQLKAEISNLEMFGDNVVKLHYLILGIKKLQKYKGDMKALEQNMNELLNDENKLESVLATLKGVETNLKSMTIQLQQLNTLTNVHNKIQALSSTYKTTLRQLKTLDFVTNSQFLDSLKSSSWIEDNSGLQTIKNKLALTPFRLNEAMPYICSYLDHHKTNLSTFELKLEATMCEFGTSLCSFVVKLNKIKVSCERISIQFKGTGIEQTKKSLEAYGKLKEDKITEFLSRLKGNIKSIAIKQIDKELMDLIEIDFCRHNIYSTKRVIKNLLTVYISKLTTCEVVDALKKIEQIKLSLDNVQEIKKKIQEIKKDLQDLKQNNTGIQDFFSLTNTSLNSPKLCKDKLKEIDDYLKPFEQQLNKLEESINDLQKNKNQLKAESERIEDQLENLKPMEGIKTKYGNKLSEISLFKNYGVISFNIDSLIEHKSQILRHKEIVDRQIEVLENEIDGYKSAIEFVKRQLKIFGDIIKISVIEIPEYITLIRNSVSKIKQEYQAYTAAFSSFKQKLLELEKCLDYLVKRFVRCSICTTICNYKGCPTLQLT